MKRLIALVVSLGVTGLFWLGCEKAKPVDIEEDFVVEKVVPPPPPPAEEVGEPEEMDEPSGSDVPEQGVNPAETTTEEESD